MTRVEPNTCIKYEHGLEIQNRILAINGFLLTEMQIELFIILEIQLKMRLSPSLMGIRLHAHFTLTFMISSQRQV